MMGLLVVPRLRLLTYFRGYNCSDSYWRVFSSKKETAVAETSLILG